MNITNKNYGIYSVLKEALKGFLTARRMDLKIHASKLPTQKTRKAAREGICVQVENNHGRLEQLKNIGTVAEHLDLLNF